MSVLLLLAALGLAVQAANCPGECTCRESTARDSSTTLECTSEAVLDLPLDTGSLTLRSDQPLDLSLILTTLEINTLPKLAQLILADCSINSLSNISFNALSHLQILDLSQNHITDLSDDSSVLNVTALRVLDLSHNSIRVLYGSPFRTLCALRVLNLSVNAIDAISVDAFNGPNSLRSLDLSGNNLTALPDRVFVPLVGLQHLNLSGNRLEVLADGCFSSLLRLQQLDVSYNRLTHVAPDTLQSLPSLSRLLLAGNPKLGGGAKEAALLVGTGRRLQTVDASRTGLKHVPATLTHSVRTLRIAGNSIRAIRCGDLDSYPLLQLLDLTTNTLDEIEEDALGRLEMLAVLYLTNNKLHAIPRSLPSGLEILHLEFNCIEQIVSGDLLDLPKLEVLLLNDNSIKVVQEGAFSQMTSLVTLDLSRNPISILPADTLAGPLQLEMLKLSGLTIDPPVEDMAFPIPSPEHLVRLDLSGSVGLARQLLADTAALAAFRELQELNLADTDLTYVRSDLLHYLPQMHEFHLTGNRLNCSDLLWLALWMRRQDKPEYRKVSCSSPSELYGTLLVDLQDTDMQDTVPTTTLPTTTTPIRTSPVTVTDYITITEQLLSERTSYAVKAFTNSQVDANMFNNISVEEQTDRSTVRGLQNTVKSSVEKKETVVSGRRQSETTEAVFVTGVEHRSGAVESHAAANRVHLFPIAPELRTETGPSTDKTGATPPVTDGHIDEINSSDNRVVTEPSNYKANAPPPPPAADESSLERETEIPWGTTNGGGEEATQAPATAALRDSELVAESSRSRYANQTDIFFQNRAGDNVTVEIPNTNVFMGSVSTENRSDTKDDENVTGTAGEMSMYSSSRHAAPISNSKSDFSLHPGMLLLLAAVLGAGIALSTLVSHVRKQKKRGASNETGYNRHQDIEVNSLASVQELW